MILFIIPWLALCFICAIAGSGKTIGYWGTFLCCLLLSPLIGLIIGLAAGQKQKPAPAYSCRWCGYTSLHFSHYCPQCFKGANGQTAEENKAQFAPGSNVKA